MQAQLSHQLQSYGKYSEMIVDYTKRSLVPVPNTEDARKLWMMVDPWFYRDRLKQPKMIVNGSNDPYWTQDALNLYWDDLKGDKWVLYVPNAGHNLVQQHDTPAILPDRSRAMNTVSAFTRHQIHGTPMPKISWQHDGANPKMQLKIQAEPAPKALACGRPMPLHVISAKPNGAIAHSRSRASPSPPKWSRPPRVLSSSSLS